MKAIVQRSVWNLLIVAIVSIGVSYVIFVSGQMLKNGSLAMVVDMLVVPLCLGAVSAIVLQGAWWMRIILISMTPLIAGILFWWKHIGVSGTEFAEASAFLMIFFATQAFVAVIAALICEGLRIRWSRMKELGSE